MKKIVVVLFIATFLFSDSYKEGLGYFKVNNFEKAYESLDEVLFEYIAENEFNFFYGRSALEIGKYNDAIAAFERMLTQDPNHDRARLELARAYYELGLYKQSQIEFERVKAKPSTPQEVREIIDEYLVKMEEEQEKHTLSAIASAGLEHDSNINNGNDNWLGGSANPEVSSSAIALSGVVSSDYRVSDEKSIKTVGGVFLKEYTQKEGKDYIYPFISSGLEFETKEYEIATPISFSTLYYDSELLLYQLSLRGEAKFKQTPEFLKSRSLKAFTVSGEITQKMFNSDNSNSNSRVLSLATSAKTDIKSGFIQYSLGYEFERKEGGHSTDIDKDTLKLGASALLSNLEPIIITPTANIDFARYKDSDVSENKKREDLKIALGVSGIYSLDKKSALVGSVSYKDSNSNLERASYNKLTVGVFYKYFFSNAQIKNWLK